MLFITSRIIFIFLLIIFISFLKEKLLLPDDHLKKNKMFKICEKYILCGLFYFYSPTILVLTVKAHHYRLPSMHGIMFLPVTVCLPVCLSVRLLPPYLRKPVDVF